MRLVALPPGVIMIGSRPLQLARNVVTITDFGIWSAPRKTSTAQFNEVSRARPPVAGSEIQTLRS